MKNNIMKSLSFSTFVGMKLLLKKYLQSNAFLNDEDLGRIVNKFFLKEVNKEAILLSAGAICEEMYFINKGCARTYYVSQKGMERTRYFAFEGSIITSLNSFISKQPSNEFVGLLEQSEILVIKRNDFYTLVADIPSLRLFYIHLLEQAYVHQNKLIENLIILSAKERFDYVMNNKPHYFQRLSNKILSSYLDISQETLSRLKSK